MDHGYHSRGCWNQNQSPPPNFTKKYAITPAARGFYPLLVSGTGTMRTT